MEHGLSHTAIRSSRAILAAAAIAVVLAACERRNTGEATSGMARPPGAADTTMRGANDTTGMAHPAPGAVGNLTDPNIVALLDEANQADSAAGALALTKATDPEVKAFAKLMMSEHHALRVQGQQLAKKLNVTPQPPASDPVQAAAATEMGVLRSAPKGEAFDRAYIDQEVKVHKAVIDLAEQAHASTNNAQLKGLIEQAKPTLQKHLQRAEEIQKKLGGSPA